MDNIEICDFELPVSNKQSGKLIVLRCNIKASNPKAKLDDAVSVIVDHKLHNQFIDINLNNPWKRLILFGINDLEYKEYDSTDSEIYERDLFDELGHKNAKLAIIRGGLRSDNPISYMEAAVHKYVKNNPYQEFTEIYLDNPWVRLILVDITEFNYKPFNK